MAEWVQKGNLKGPQGDPGQDAQLPAGGTEGQVLTKTSGGEAWADVPQPDMTGVVKISDGLVLESGDSPIEGFFVSSASDMAAYATVFSSLDSVGFSAASPHGLIAIGVADDGPRLTIVDKFVTSITDSISDSPTGSALVTDKAIADYVAANAPSVPNPLPISQGGTGATTAEGARTALGIPDIEVATDEEFDSYMGLS